MVRQLSVNAFVKQQVVRLRLDSDWPQRLIAHALDLKVTAVNNILFKYKKHGPAIFSDRRRFNRGTPKRMSDENVDRICSYEMLQVHAGLSLTDRCVDLSRRLGITVSTSALRGYYMRKNVKVRAVDLHNVNKINRAGEIKQQQKDFVARLRRIQHRKQLYYMDQTSIHLWSTAKRTWSTAD